MVDPDDTRSIAEKDWLLWARKLKRAAEQGKGVVLDSKFAKELDHLLEKSSRVIDIMRSEVKPRCYYYNEEHGGQCVLGRGHNDRHLWPDGIRSWRSGDHIA